MPRPKHEEAPESEDELLDDDLDELATGRELDANDLASLGQADLEQEQGEEDDEDEDEDDEDEWGSRRDGDDDEWTRDAWSDYMSTRAAVRADGGNGGSFFYE